MSFLVRKAETNDLRALGEMAAPFVAWMRSLDQRLSIAENTAQRWTSAHVLRST